MTANPLSSSCPDFRDLDAFIQAAESAETDLERSIAEDAIAIARFEPGATIRDYVVQPEQIHHMIY